MSENASRVREAVVSRPTSKAWSYVVLTKPDVTFLVVITTVAGFYLGSTGPLDWPLLLHTLFATMLVAGGTAALNQYVERDMDAVMRRTAARPLPMGTLQPRDRNSATMFFRFAASFTVGAVMRTIWQPTATRSSVCWTLAAVSMVSQVIIDCTTTGWSPPMMTPPFAGSPTTTSRVLRRW